jgi:hypothetical protein
MKKINAILGGTTVLCIDVLETPDGFMVLFEDEYLDDDNGDNCWDTFADAMDVLKAQLQVTK